ncbi:MAG: hypothetical protein OXD43_06210 [Bacteroidetes bacterium]|nr:hypothetical protein [Bacteroidota bacterium]
MTLKKHEIDVSEIARTECKTITIPEMELAMRQIMSHPSEAKRKSENREPTEQELKVGRGTVGKKVALGIKIGSPIRWSHR